MAQNLALAWLLGAQRRQHRQTYRKARETLPNHFRALCGKRSRNIGQGDAVPLRGTDRGSRPGRFCEGGLHSLPPRCAGDARGTRKARAEPRGEGSRP
jgi:hypothetical protein